MKRIVTAVLAVAAIGLATILPARAAFPALTLIYLVPGVVDSGVTTGNATVVNCTNVSGVAVSLRVILFTQSGSTIGTATTGVVNGATSTISTHFTSLFTNEDAIEGGVAVNAGQIRIYATRATVHCTASIVDSAETAPSGIDLHMIRYNAASGTVE